MKRTLLRSPSLHRFLSHKTKLLSSTSTGYPRAACTRFPSLSLPFSTIFPRPLHSLKVLAMAERSSSPATSSHSHKFTNRLAAEHSPYLLQHAHNPVSAIHLHIGLFIIVFLLCAQRVVKEKKKLISFGIFFFFKLGRRKDSTLIEANDVCWIG